MSMRDRIEQALQAIDPAYLEVRDESHMHHRGPESHFKAIIVSDRFEGKTAVKRHQSIYALMPELMGQMHALSLHTYTPEEWDGLQVPDSPACRGGGKR